MITSGFLFSGLQTLHEATFFGILALEPCCGEGFGCYIGLSGFSASRVFFASKQKMYTTYVTAGTADASKKKIEQGKHSWLRYSTVAPTPWLARVWFWRG
jgi:hypothetical protein